MRILVTGATGFVGPHLIRRLSAKHEVAVLLRPQARTQRLAGINPAPKQLVWDGVATSLAPLLETFHPDAVMHLATSFFGSVHKTEDIDAMIDGNVRFPSVLVDAMVKIGCKNLISTGSIAQHCNNATYAPLNLFAASKQAFADILTYFINVGGLGRAVTVELADTFGPDDPRTKLLQMLMKSAASGEALGMSPGGQHVDFTHVDDVVSAFERALELVFELPMGQQRTYAVRSNKPMTVKAFVELFNSINTKPAKVEWGKRNYHGPEFLTPWQQGEMLPGWKPTISLQDGLTALLKTQRAA